MFLPLTVSRNDPVSSPAFELLPKHQETEKSKWIFSTGLPSYLVTLQPEDRFTHTAAHPHV